MKYRDENGVFQDLYLPPTGDTLPIGSEVDYDGTEVPYGWEETTNPESYSTEEVKTNEIYIDGNGKKWAIYQKMFVTPIKNFNTGTYELGTLDDTCLIMKWYPTFINSSNAQFQMSNPNTELYHQSGKVSVNFKTNWGSGHVELIVKYRKTTD